MNQICIKLKSFHCFNSDHSMASRASITQVHATGSRREKEELFLCLSNQGGILFYSIVLETLSTFSFTSCHQVGAAWSTWPPTVRRKWDCCEVLDRPYPPRRAGRVFSKCPVLWCLNKIRVPLSWENVEHNSIWHISD